MENRIIRIEEKLKSNPEKRLKRIGSLVFLNPWERKSDIGLIVDSKIYKSNGICYKILYKNEIKKIHERYVCDISDKIKT